MPKLRDQVVRKNQEAIEDAALRLFIRQGYFGTSIRDIASEAGISIGNIYNYYPNKEALYVSMVRRHTLRMAKKQAALKPLLGRFDAASLRQLADAVRAIVYSNPDYWRLMYIDVTEFGNRHFSHSFRRLSRLLEKLAGGYQAGPLRPGIDPSAAYAAIYLQFFTYFLVEKLFGGRQHLGLPEGAAIEQLIRIFREGVAVAPVTAAGVGGAGEDNHEGNHAPDPAIAPRAGVARDTPGTDTNHRPGRRNR